MHSLFFSPFENRIKINESQNNLQNDLNFWFTFWIFLLSFPWTCSYILSLVAWIHHIYTYLYYIRNFTTVFLLLVSLFCFQYFISIEYIYNFALHCNIERVFFALLRYLKLYPFVFCFFDKYSLLFWFNFCYLYISDLTIVNKWTTGNKSHIWFRQSNWKRAVFKWFFYGSSTVFSRKSKCHFHFQKFNYKSEKKLGHTKSK